jgi:hypothetical protein
VCLCVLRCSNPILLTDILYRGYHLSLLFTETRPEAYIDDSGCDLTELRSSEDLAQRLISSVQIQPDDKEGDGLLTRSISVMHRSAPASVITKEILATRWYIGLESAARTLNVTTQNGIQKVVIPVERRFRTKQSHFPFPTLDGK